MSRYFIITVDTEPDGQWDIEAPETTENAKYINRFQELCNKYGYKPVYLTDYRMLEDSYFVKMMRRFVNANICEIGMHLHAWDTPPIVDLDTSYGNRPYLIEYTTEVMEQKIESLTMRLNELFQSKITTHRAGRWALDERYVKLLSKYGYTVDCSVTPHIDWSNVGGKSCNSKGSDYRLCKEEAYYMENSNILEIPVTVRKIGRIDTLKSCEHTPKAMAKALVKGGTYWFRPALFEIKQMRLLYEKTKDDEYIEMMIHSSELMPGGSPYFPNQESIEQLYKKMNELFKMVSETHTGITLRDYAQIVRSIK